MEQILKKIALGITLIMFVVPLVVLPKVFVFPFVFPKIILFRSLILLLLGVYLLLVFLRKEKYFFKRPKLLDWTIIIFSLGLIVSAIVGVDLHRSLWDNHERMLGVVTWVHFIVLYFLVSRIFEPKEWKTIIKGLLISGSVVMVSGIIQKFFPYFILNQGQTRVHGTLGNSIYFSAFGLFLFFLALQQYFQEKQSSLWKKPIIIMALLGFVGVFIGGSRGTIIGLVVGLGALLALYGFFSQHKEVKRKSIIFGLIGIAAVVCVFLFKNTAFIQHIPGVSRLAGTSFSLHSKEPRVIAWNIAIEAWREKPIFGWGTNNYFYAFNKYYDPALLRSGWGETWFDSAHNLVLNQFATGGIVGGFTYIALFVVSIIILLRAIQKDRDSLRFYAPAIAFLLAHFVHNFFVFENPVSVFYIFIFLGYLWSYMYYQEISTKSGRKYIPIGYVLFVVFVIFVGINNINIRPAKANYTSLLSLRTLYTDPQKSLVFLEKALSYQSPHSDDVIADYAKSVNGILPQYAKIAQKSDVNKMWQTVHDTLLINLKKHPLDIRTHVILSELIETKIGLFGEKELYHEYESIITQALVYSPRRQQLEYMLAQVKIGLNKPEDALVIIEKSVENDPQIESGWSRLIYLNYFLGRKEKALELLGKAKSIGIVFTENNIKMIEAVEEGR